MTNLNSNPILLCEKEIVKLKNFYEQILNHISAEITVYDKDSQLEYINPSEVSDKEIRTGLIGKNDYDLCIAKDIDVSVAKNRTQLLKHVMLTGESIQFEEQIQYNSSSEIHYYIRTMTPLLDVNNRILNVVRYGFNITRRKNAESEVEYIANHDSLTALPNRRSLYNKLESFFKNRTGNSEELCALFLCDLDRFKTINDSLGHVIGDLLIQSVAIRLKEIANSFSDCFVYRLGGDEFIISMMSISSKQEAQFLARLLLEKFNEPFMLKEHELFVSTSIGIYIFNPEKINDIEQIIHNADIAMYVAKETGRNSYKFYIPGMSNKNEVLFKMETKILRAFRHNSFKFHYQPIIQIGNRKIVGVEALIRWYDGNNVIEPSQFLDIAENSGVLVNIENSLIPEAMSFIHSINVKTNVSYKLAINISDKHFYHENFIDKLDQYLLFSGFDSSLLIIELNENIIMRIPKISKIILAELKKREISIAIDDYGSGSSSLSQLKEYPIDIINIGRDFTSGINENYQDAAVTGSLISMSHKLNIKVHVEGVENHAQLDYLNYLKCNTVQGYLFSKPLSDSEILDMLLEN